MCSGDLFLGIVAMLFPPLPVWVKCGICSADSIINILLCCLGVVPGVLHAWYIIAKFPEPDYERVDESERGNANGRVTYVVVRSNNDDPRRALHPSGRGQPNKPPPRQANMSYGTNGGAGSSSAAAGPSEGAPPPTYAQAVSGDHKIQDQS